MDDLERRELLLRMARAQIGQSLAMLKIQRSLRDSLPHLQRFGMAVAALDLEAADQGEFDNRAHDWLRAE